MPSKKPTRRATKKRSPSKRIVYGIINVHTTRLDNHSLCIRELETKLSALESRLPPITQFSPEDKSRWWSRGDAADGTWCFGNDAEHIGGTFCAKGGSVMQSGFSEDQIQKAGCHRIPRPDWWPQKIEAKQPCEHPDLEYTPDPSGNNDVLWKCHRCGGEWSRRPRPAKPKTLREIAEAVGRRLKVIGDSTPREIVNDGSRQALLVAAAVCRNRAKQFEASRFHEVEHTVLTTLAHDCEQEAKR